MRLAILAALAGMLLALIPAAPAAAVEDPLRCDPFTKQACDWPSPPFTMVSPVEGWANGGRSTLMRYLDGRWVRTAVDLGGEPYYGLDLRQITMLSPEEGWAVVGRVGSSGTITTAPGVSQSPYAESFFLHYQGGVWRRSRLEPLDQTLDFFSVGMASASLGWAVGQAFARASDPPNQPINPIAEYRDGRWRLLTKVRDPLYAVAARSASEAWAVGRGGVFYRLLNGGWVKHELPVDQRTTLDLTAIAFLPNGEGWAAGRDYLLYRYRDGDWTREPLCGICGARGPTQFSFASPGEGLLGGNEVLLRRTAGRWGFVSLPEESYIRAVSMPSEDAVFAMTLDGTLLREISGQWKVQTPPPRKGILRDVAMTSSATGWAVGDAGQILRYQGGRWQDYASDPPLRAVATAADGTGWAVGRRGTIVRLEAGAWRQVESPTFLDLHAVALTGPDSGWAAGDNGVLLQLAGGRWSVVASPSVRRIEALGFPSPTFGWAGGEFGMLRFAVGGWTSVAVSGALGFAIQSLSHGWAIGSLPDQTTLSHLLRFQGSWQGQSTTWCSPRSVQDDCPTPAGIAAAPSPTGTSTLWIVGNFSPARIVGLTPAGAQPYTDTAFSRLNAVSAPSETSAWAVGAAGAIARWDGSAWAKAASPTTGDLLAVSVSTGGAGWAVGEGTILELRGGQWQPVVVNRATSVALREIVALSDEDAWAIGERGQLLRREAGRWTVVPTPLSGPLTGPYPIDDPITTLDVFPNGDGWILGRTGTVLRLRDGAWGPVAIPGKPRFTNAGFISPDRGWASALSIPATPIDPIWSILWEYRDDAWRKVPATVGSLLPEAFFSGPGWIRANGPELTKDGVPSTTWYLWRWDGNAWQKEAPLGYIYDVVMLAPDNGWASAGQLYHFDGANWTAVSPAWSGLAFALDTAGGQVWGVGANGDRTVVVSTIPGLAIDQTPRIWLPEVRLDR
ncbi:MAG: hypothetical protein U0556_07865 [Dehalococcoidia bacterium]